MKQKKKFELMCDATNEVLFDGWFETIKDCVEQAVADSICLDGVNLASMNLACANLDDAQMTGANLSGANLNGANLSEGIFDCATMAGADLSHACLALSSLMNVDMTGAFFAATDVTDAVITGCQFSCPSVFTTIFGRAALFSGCSFVSEEKGICPMSKPPIVISGLQCDIVYMDTIIKIGHDFISKIDLVAAGDRHLEFIYGADIAAFIRPVLYEKIDNL